MPTCLVVQHLAPEAAFTIEDALVAAGVSVDTRRVYAGDPLPDQASDLDGVVVMGGSMSATSDAGFPSRRAELALLAGALGAGIPILGVCLGAQLLAASVGARVYPGTSGPEIGWRPIQLAENCSTDPLLAGLPETLTVLQWHGDTFELPEGACHLARSALYPNQAFRIGSVAWGVQFHLEVTEAAIDGFIADFGHELAAVEGGASGLVGATAGAVAALAGARELVFGRFAGLVATRVTSGGLVHQG